MTLKVGYTSLIQDMKESEQREVLKQEVEEKRIISEPDRRRMLLTVLPEQLEKGSTVYVVNLSVLGDRAYRIDTLLDKFKKKGIRVVSLREGLDTQKENDWSWYLKKIADVERNALYQNREKANKERKGGRKKIELTPEILEVLVKYESGKITLKQATDSLKCGNTTFYSLLNRNRKEIKEGMNEELEIKAMELQKWLKEVEEG